MCYSINFMHVRFGFLSKKLTSKHLMQNDVKIDVLRSCTTSSYDFWIFTVWDYFFLSHLINSRLKVLPKSVNVVYLSEIMAMTFKFRDRTADVTYCADVTLFLYAMSGGLSLTAAFFLRQLLAFFCFKCYFGSFSKCKTAFSPNIITP